MPGGTAGGAGPGGAALKGRVPGKKLYRSCDWEGELVSCVQKHERLSKKRKQHVEMPRDRTAWPKCQLDGRRAAEVPWGELPRLGVRHHCLSLRSGGRGELRCNNKSFPCENPLQTDSIVHVKSCLW